GGNMGRTDIGKCTSVGSLAGGFTDGCNPNQNLNIENGDGVYEQNLSGIRTFQRFGGIQPGNGGLWGMRFGFNVNPRWQIEFIYNHVYSGTSFTNQDLAQQRIALLNGGFQPCCSGFSDHRLIYLDHAYGTPRGEQNQYLVNINRNFNAGGRIVPYIGGGLGVVHWYAGPKLNISTQTGRTGGTSFGSAEITKYSQPDTGFAFDAAAGVKAYLTSNFGVRGDITQVWSFPGNLNSAASSIDLGGTVGGTPGGLFPVSGKTSQSGRFSQTAFTGGVFWAFGGGWQNEHPNVGSFGNSNDNFWDHWELSWTFGGVHGRDLGQGQYHCTSALTNGCLYNDLTLYADQNRGGTGVYERMQLDALPNYLANGYVKPGDGWATGGRLAYSFNPSWDLAFVWNLAGTGSHFSNQPLFDTALAEFYRADDNAVPAKAATALGGHDGRASGTESMYLFNVDRNFHVSRRFVPYIGAGLGWVSWNNGPNTQYRFDRSGAGTPNVYDVFKTARNENLFAIDLGGGAKYYLTRHFGVRADVMDVFSFGDFRTDFGTVDTSGHIGPAGALVPVSGRVSGDARYSQIVTQAGVFWSFGQGGTWNSDYSNTGSGRWDFSLQTGGVVGGDLGQTQEPTCKSIATAGTLTGCNMNQSLTHTENGIYPGRMGAFVSSSALAGSNPGMAACMVCDWVTASRQRGRSNSSGTMPAPAQAWSIKT
ncbi:MAG TPA: hypothetical protein VFV14_11385, partial [Myxococcaceae bacterium]|nr:hypothetical protein [Myxococcaceae bacterium]